MVLSAHLAQAARGGRTLRMQCPVRPPRMAHIHLLITHCISLFVIIRMTTRTRFVGRSAIAVARLAVSLSRYVCHSRPCFFTESMTALRYT